MQRYFVNEIKDNYVILDKEQAHHIVNVMRMKIGDYISCVFQKSVYLCKINSINPLKVEIEEDLRENHELNNPIILLYCLPKGEKLELVIQKATEIGVSEIILIQSERCIAKINKENKDKKLARFNKIALEASEQSKRNIVPLINKVIDYKQIKDYKFDHMFIAYENEKQNFFKEQLMKVKENESVAVLVGSEGGFSKQEVEYACSLGYQSISLGKRILRSETAAIFSLSCISFMLERE
ncbi:MAG: RsmE family RNA methyltransferase [Bacillales bacterium]|nr:RsmE family RNA methyltransferase [Bacillales bacterium]